MDKRFLVKQAIRLIGLIIFIVIIANTDFSHVDLILTSSEQIMLILAFFLTIPIMVLKGLRWFVISKNLGIRITPAEATTGLCIAQMTSFTLPGSLGDLIRIPFLKCRGNPTDRSILSIFLDAVAASVIPYSVAAISILVLFDVDSSILVFLLSSTLFVSAAVYVAYKVVRVTIWPWLSRARIRRIKSTGIQGRFFVSLREALGLIHVRSIALSIFLAAGAWYVYTLQGWVLSYALGMSVDWFIIAMALTLASMFSTIPISIQGIGVREGILLLVLGFFGLDTGRIVVFSIVLTLISLTPSLWGLISWLRDPFVEIKSEAVEESITKPLEYH
ncbi:MAG: YbhN family protein [Candidatus Thorarchaeota archaeon]